MLFFICSNSELDVMVSLENSSSNGSRLAPWRSLFLSASTSNTRVQRSIGRSMRTIRSNFLLNEQSPSFASFPAEKPSSISEALSEAAIDIRLGELVGQSNKPEKLSATEEELLDLSHTFSHFSACSSDISGELQRLASLPHGNVSTESDQEPEPHLGFLTEITESISPEDLEPTIKLCINTLEESSVAEKQSAAAKLRFLAKNKDENRGLIGECGAIPALIPLLRSGDPCLQEHTVTALLNLSLHDENKEIITQSGAIKPLIYVLKTGTETSKQNAACALLSLALVEENKGSIGACGAIPPLISLLVNGSSRGKKDALTTMYKLCSIKVNKERGVSAGAVKPLVDLVADHGSGLAEKAMVVLSCLASIPEGKVAIVEEGGVAALVEAVENGSVKGKEFAVVTLLQLCGDSFGNRALVVREGGIPPLVSLSRTGSARAKPKAETLLGYLRELRHEASSSSLM